MKRPPADRCERLSIAQSLSIDKCSLAAVISTRVPENTTLRSLLVRRKGVGVLQEVINCSTRAVSTNKPCRSPENIVCG